MSMNKLMLLFLASCVAPTPSRDAEFEAAVRLRWEKQQAEKAREEEQKRNVEVARAERRSQLELERANDKQDREVRELMARGNSCSAILDIEKVLPQHQKERLNVFFITKKRERYASDQRFVEGAMRETRAVGEDSNLERASLEADQLEAKAIEMAPCDDLGQGFAIRVKEWNAARKQDLAKEQQCRDDKVCAGKRAAKPLCDLIERRQACVSDMDKEHRNPSGYVSKSKLYELGSDIQNIDEDLARLKPEYQKAFGKPFSVQMCR